MKNVRRGRWGDRGREELAGDEKGGSLVVGGALGRLVELIGRQCLLIVMGERQLWEEGAQQALRMKRCWKKKRRYYGRNVCL